MMMLWTGQDGCDDGLQCDNCQMWDAKIAGNAEVCAHDSDCLTSINDKSNGPGPYSLLPYATTTLLAIAEVEAANLGATIDFAHFLFACGQPACAAALIARNSPHPEPVSGRWRCQAR